MAATVENLSPSLRSATPGMPRTTPPFGPEYKRKAATVVPPWRTTSSPLPPFVGGAAVKAVDPAGEPSLPDPPRKVKRRAAATTTTTVGTSTYRRRVARSRRRASRRAERRSEREW
jgi:hypothetical protein